MSKKLINSPDSCVEDLIHGLLYANPMLSQVQGCNALVHSSIESLREEQVTLISGGGSGHEPAHAGYIGNGCIHGAVLGHVFASPSVQSIYNTIRVAAGSKGVILLVKNYTGDRLNFGMALEKAKQEGVHGKMIIVDDDCALPPGKGITGGRGIAGTVLVHKICGALAAYGHSVDHIFDFMQIILPNIRTMGVALSMCHLPSQIHHPSNRLAGERAIEIGMGIHGEQGREQAELPTSNAAKYIASVMVDAVLTRLGINDNDEDVEEDREVVVLLNNLGCLPALEMGIVLKEVTEKLLAHSCRPVRIYAGSFMTSLDMNGVSLSILNLSLLGIEMREHVLSCLDHPTNAPAWTPTLPIPSSKDHFDVAKRTIQPILKEKASDATIPTANVVDSLRINVDVLNVVRLVCNRIIAVEPQLSEYDAVCGDGDCGTVMKKGATAVLALCDQTHADSGVSIPQFLDQVADAVSASMGGTSGVLLEICFRAMSSHFSSKTSGQEDLSKLWIGSLASGVDAIRYYGGADVGMRTMLDALVPAVESLKSGRSIDVSAQAASAGVEATKTMQSLAGRSNYVAQEKMQGVPDPGAYAMAAAFEALVGHL